MEDPQAQNEPVQPQVSAGDSQAVPPQPDLPASGPPVPMFPPEKGKPKIVLWVGLGLLLLAVAGVGAYYFIFRETTPTPSPTPVPTQAPTSTPDPTANWRTHSGAYYEVRYPPGWYFEGVVLYGFEHGNFTSYSQINELMKNSDNPLIIRFDTIYANEDQKQLPFSGQQDEWYEWIEEHKNNMVNYPGSTIQEGSFTTIDNIRTISLNVCYEEGYAAYSDYPCSEHLFIPHGEILANIEMHGDLSLLSIAKQILSTFKFTEATPSATPTSTPSATTSP